MQTILGSGGTIGVELAKFLKSYTDKIRLVSRNPQKINKDDELYAADLTNPGEVDKAVAGSEIVYVTIGFKYDYKVWQNTWPPFITAVVNACKKHNSKLVFFDNIYMYDPGHLNNLTEETPIKPASKKGEVRTEVFRIIKQAIDNGDITALIARAPDFYGGNNSLLTELVHKNYKKEKTAQWFGNPKKIHTFINIKDAAKGTAILGNTPDAYGEVWHLPTTNERLTSSDWVNLYAKEMNVEPKVFVMPNWLMSLLGFFIPILKELKEMNYQFENDYIFDSTKFQKRFKYEPIKPEDGVKVFCANEGSKAAI